MQSYGYSRPWNRIGWSPYRWSSILWIGGGVLGAVLGVKYGLKPANKLGRGVLGAFLGMAVLGGIGDKFIENHHPDSNSQR